MVFKRNFLFAHYDCTLFSSSLWPKKTERLEERREVHAFGLRNMML